MLARAVGTVRAERTQARVPYAITAEASAATPSSRSVPVSQSVCFFARRQDFGPRGIPGFRRRIHLPARSPKAALRREGYIFLVAAQFSRHGDPRWAFYGSRNASIRHAMAHLSRTDFCRGLSTIGEDPFDGFFSNWNYRAAPAPTRTGRLFRPRSCTQRGI